MLTDGCRADSVPNLEIETGEIVGAGHASTTGRFDDEQLFYLRSRGIDEAEARRLVVHGFFADIIRRIGVPELERQLLADASRPSWPSTSVTPRARPHERASYGPAGWPRLRLRVGHLLCEIGGTESPSCTATARFYAIADECSHASIPLSEGDVDEGEIECYLHGSRFDLPTGEPTGLPATEPVAVYRCHVAGRRCPRRRLLSVIAGDGPEPRSSRASSLETRH